MTLTQQDSRELGAGALDVAPGTPDTEAESAVAERFRWARRQGHPAWLWPDVTVPEWRAALVELERIAAALLRGETSVSGPGQTMQPEAIGLAAYTSGLGPWLGRHVSDGRLDGEERSAALVGAHLDHARRRARRMSSAFQRVHAAFEASNVNATLLKGMHTAAVYFAEPALRPMADIDVLVDAGDVARAERVLGLHGYVERKPERLARPYRSEWRPRDAPALPRSLSFVHGDDPFAIDLHGTLDIDFFGVRTVAFGDASNHQPAYVTFGGTPARVLAQPLLAAHLAVHASHGLHGLTLIRLVELALVLRADMRSDDDWRQLTELLQSLDAGRFAFPALALVDRLAPDVVPATVLGRMRRAAPARLRAVIDELRPATAQRIDALALDERFMWAATPAEHLRRLGNMLLPTGTRGPVRRLGRIYAERAYRMVRGRVTLRGARND